LTLSRKLLAEDVEEQKQPQETGRASLSEIKKRGRKTNEEIIAEYQRKQAAGGQAAPPPAIVLHPRHVEGLCNIPFAGIGWITKEPLWNLSKDEQEFLSNPLADFLNEILPELARKYPKGAILAICFVSVATKKLGDIAQKKPISVLREAREEAPKHREPAPIVLDNAVGGDGMTVFERNLRKRERGEN
jgi:hypothetical protein